MARAVRRHRLAVAAVTPLLLFSAAACSGDTAETPQAGEPSASATSPSPSPTESPSATESPAQGQGRFTDDNFVPALKQAVAQQSSSHLELRLDGGGQQAFTAEGDSSLDDENPAMELTLSGPAFGGDSVELVAVDGLVYLSGLPGTTQGKFVRIDPQDPNDPLGRNFRGLTQQLDPTSTFDAFEAGLVSVEYVEDARVQGTPTEKYRVTVDSAKAMRAQGRQPVPGLPETLTYQVWIDAQDLMRRVRFQLGPVSFEGTLSQWGAPVDIEAPPPSRVVENPQLQG